MSASNPDARQFYCCEDNRTLSTPIASYVVDTITDLRAMSTSLVQANEVAQTLGYHTVGDGGGNTFYWDSTGVEVDNYGSIIKPADRSVGKWKALSAGVNARQFGAKGDGTTNDSAAFGYAVSALPATGGTVFVPAGTYRLTTPVILYGLGKTIDLRGEGSQSTILSGDLTSASVLQLGLPLANSQYKGKVSNLSITRAAGSLPGGTIGISAEAVNYAVIEDVEISRHDIGLKTNHSWVNTSLGLAINRVTTINCVVHYWLKTIAEVFISFSDLGVNGTETIAPTSLIVLDGNSNDIRIKTTQFIPRISNTANAFKWVNAATTGYYRFEDINIENLATAFASDATATLIPDLAVTNSRITPDGKLFDFNAATALSNISLINNRSLSFTATTITSASKSKFSGNFVSGGLTFSGGEWNVSGNTFTSDVVFSGAFTALAIGPNTLVFNAAAAITLDLSGATGNISYIGAAADAGTQPASRLPGALTVAGTLTSTGAITATGGITTPAFTAPSLLNSWVNFGAGNVSAGYRKEATGIVRLTGLIKDGTQTAGTTLFTLPSGYRPTGTITFIAASGVSFGSVYVNAIGDVVLNINAPGTNICLDGITFSTT